MTENSLSFDDLRKKAIELTKKKIKESVSKDLMIINAINNVEELEKSINVLTGRLREWYALTNPELVNKISDNEKFVEIVLKDDASESVMGAPLDSDDEKAVKAQAVSIHALIQTKTFLLLYLEATMDVVCKNVLTLSGSTIGAKLIREAGSLKRLAYLQSSTVQLLGAEKALFRHIKTGARSPKYGHIVNHPLITGAKKDDRGKVARALADKISIAARVDYFKGEFIGEELLKELQSKFGNK